MLYEEVTKVLFEEFPDFHMDHDDDFDLPYIVAGYFGQYLLDSYNNGARETYKRGLDFIERLHLSNIHKVRELATVGYLESLLGWPDEAILFSDLGSESKKWWSELNLFWSGKVRYIGETFDQTE